MTRTDLTAHASDVETLAMYARLTGDDTMCEVATRVLDALGGDYPDGALPGSTWRVQYIAHNPGEPDEDIGRLDFPTEEKARAYFAGEAAAAAVSAYWRVELRVQPPAPTWRVVESLPYKTVEDAASRS